MMDGRDGESEREREERSTNTGMSVVHSLFRILVTFSVFHDAMGPCVPSPWPGGTSMSAYVVHVPLPLDQEPE